MSLLIKFSKPMAIKHIAGFSQIALAALFLFSIVRETAAQEAQPFPLSDVRLLDSPFKQAMERDEAYLLSLDPNRLLSGFRKEAGLTPKAPTYGGWESQGIAGHTLGHYLSACSLMYQSTGDARFANRVRYIVSELAECQKANGNGYVAAIPNGKVIFSGIQQGNIKSADFSLNGGWVPWYTLHKEFAGLIDAYQLCTNTQALEVVTDLANWAEATTKNLTDEQWQRMLVCEQGGMNESLANLYAITGNTNYLALAKKFYHVAVMEPLARGEDTLNGLHSNMQIPKVIGAARIYELTGDTHFADIANFFWADVAQNRSYVIGGNGDNEHFFPTNQFSRHLSAAAAETCCTYNMLKLTRHLFEWHPSAVAMDFYERALYNDILASQDPETGMFVYLMSLNPGGFKTYSTPEDSFWCCVPTCIIGKETIGDIDIRTPSGTRDTTPRKASAISVSPIVRATQFCEPVFGINCGMALGGISVPMNNMEPWVQDALDAIRPRQPNSMWGARHFKPGHRRQISIWYMEIGNENVAWPVCGLRSIIDAVHHQVCSKNQQRR